MEVLVKPELHQLNLKLPTCAAHELRCGHYGVYDLLELYLNTLSKIVQNTDNNSKALEDFAGAIVDWADGQEDAIDKWKADILKQIGDVLSGGEGSASFVIGEGDILWSHLSDDVKKKILANGGALNITAIKYTAGGDITITLGEGTDAQTVAGNILFANSVQVPPPVPGHEAQDTSKYGGLMSVEDYQDIQSLKKKLGIEIKSVTLNKDCSIVIVTTDGKKNTIAPIFAKDATIDEEAGLDKDKVGGFMTLAQSEKLASLKNLEAATGTKLGGVKVNNTTSGLNVDSQGNLTTSLAKLGITIDQTTNKMYIKVGDKKYYVSVSLDSATPSTPSLEFIYVGGMPSSFDPNAASINVASLTSDANNKKSVESGVSYTYSCTQPYFVILAPTSVNLTSVMMAGLNEEIVDEDSFHTGKTVSVNGIVHNLYYYKISLVSAENPQGYTYRVSF